MAFEIEKWIAGNVLLVGWPRETDESFDHAFGTEKRRVVEIEDLHVILYVDGIDHDVTSSFSEQQLFSFSEQLLEKGI